MSFSNVTILAKTAISFGATSENAGANGLVPGSDGGASLMYEITGATGVIDKVPLTVGGLLFMAVGGDGESTSIAGGLFGAAISTDNGATYEAVDFGKRLLTSQDVKYEASSGLFAVTGGFIGDPVSFALSSDLGQTWDVVSADASLIHDTGAGLRYGSYPSSETFYVTAGFWNDTEAGLNQHRLTSMLSIETETGELSMKPLEYDANDDESGLGWWGQVLKTSDGGASWSVVYEDIDNGFYPNDIHCVDEDTCTFVMEGQGAPRIFSTTDGGANWDMFEDTSGGISLMAVRMTESGETWAAGGGDQGRFWHGAAGGNGYDAYTVPRATAAMVTAFSDMTADIVYATGALASNLCSVFTIQV